MGDFLLFCVFVCADGVQYLPLLACLVGNDYVSHGTVASFHAKRLKITKSVPVSV
jgi:hypothetical protein